MSLRTLLFKPRGFLIVGGMVLLVLGILGFLGMFTAQSFYLTLVENVGHTALGVVALAAVYLPGLNTALAANYRRLVIAIGLITLFFGVYGLLLPAGNPPTVMNTFGIANLEFYDSVIHLIIAAWAFAAAFRTEESTLATH